MIIVGIESGTSYAVNAGTRTFTISGLAGKLSKSAIRGVELIRSGTSTPLLYTGINNWTITENTGVYTIDYSALTGLTALQAGDTLIIKCIKDSGETQINGKLDLIKTGVDALGGLVVTSTQPEVFNSTTGYFNCRSTGMVSSFTGVTNFYINGVLSSVGSVVNYGDKIRAIVPSTGTYNFVVKVSSSIYNSENTSRAESKVVGNAYMLAAKYSNAYGLCKCYQHCIVDNSDNIVLGFHYISTRTSTISQPRSPFGEDNDYIYAQVTNSSLARFNKSTGVITLLSITATAATEIVVWTNEIVIQSNINANYVIVDKTTFTQRFTGNSTASSAMVAGSYLYIGVSAGNITAVNLATNATTSITTSTILSMFLASDGYLYAFSANTIYKIDTTTNTIANSLTWTGGTPWSCVEYDGYLFLVAQNVSKGILPVRLSDFTAGTAFDTTMTSARCAVLTGNTLIIANTSGRIRTYTLSTGSGTFIRETVTSYSDINTMGINTTTGVVCISNYALPGYSTYLISDLI